LIINGAFGVGKTTVAGLIRRAVPGSLVYDPELAGWALRRLSRWIHMRGAGTDDFQDLELWRKSAVAGVRLVRAVAQGPVVVPMAFSRRDYFDEVVGGMSVLDSTVRVFCLRAGMSTILGRLAMRGDDVSGEGSEWIVRKARACVAAHEDEYFGEPIDTEQRSAREIAQEILDRLGFPDSPPNQRLQRTADAAR
jgi:broad-specificity NMP kinase